MNSPGILKTILNAGGVLLFWLGVGGVLYLVLRKSRDPGRLISKWIVTGVVLAGAAIILPNTGRFIIPFTLPFGLVLALIWTRTIAEMFANPFAGMIDGGDREIEARAYYSRAENLRRRSEFREAIAEIRKQIEKFPNDFGGQMLLAEINAENLKDLQSAEIVIQKIAHQTNHTSGQVAGALHALADWHLKLAQDPDSARVVLEQIIERFPDTQFSQMASQRIAHLGSVDSLLANHERPTIALKHLDPYATLSKASQKPSGSTERDPSAEATQCLKYLEKYPLDTEAREKLAAIYAHDFQRIDLAASELEELITR
ncbi:MAG: hypothetical protein ABIP71_06030, partial [Verrucomicrobiota bacterium]